MCQSILPEQYQAPACHAYTSTYTFSLAGILLILSTHNNVAKR